MFVCPPRGGDKRLPKGDSPLLDTPEEREAERSKEQMTGAGSSPKKRSENRQKQERLMQQRLLLREIGVPSEFERDAELCLIVDHCRVDL